MLEVTMGVLLMLGLFSVLLGGMLVVTRGDDDEFEPGGPVDDARGRPPAGSPT
jgi:hypothetical protein